MNKILLDLKTECNFAFGQLYKDNFYKISRFVQNNNGTETEAQDLFQDSMIVLVQKLRTDNFQLTASINTYVYAICKNLLFKQLRNKAFHFNIDCMNDPNFKESIDASIENETTYLERLKHYLTKITSHCSGLIRDIFFKNKTIEDIQAKYGYTTKHNAHNQKYKCLQQIKKIKKAEEEREKVNFFI